MALCMRMRFSRVSILLRVLTRCLLRAGRSVGSRGGGAPARRTYARTERRQLRPTTERELWEMTSEKPVKGKGAPAPSDDGAGPYHAARHRFKEHLRDSPPRPDIPVNARPLFSVVGS